MRKAKPHRAARKRGERHALLIYQRFSEQNFWPSVAILVASASLLIWNPPRTEPFRALLTVAAACSGLVLALSFLYRLRAYAQCLADGLRVQLPFYRLTIPYQEIRATRPSVLYQMHPPDSLKPPQRRFLRSLFGVTMVVIDLDAPPAPSPWLRLWINKYMLPPEGPGLILAVRDWIAFRTELDEFRARMHRL